MKKNLVMVVDDEKDFADSVAAFLRKIGYEAITAYSAKEAFENINKNKPFMGIGGNRIRCILLDIKMPEMDGLQFLDQLRAKREDKIGVIMLTAYEDEDKWLEVASAYAAGYIKKPFREEEIRNTLKRFFEGKEDEMAEETMEDYLAGEEKRKAYKEKHKGSANRNPD
jgi:DNA-binding response OmpR family regulator